GVHCPCQSMMKAATILALAALVGLASGAHFRVAPYVPGVDLSHYDNVSDWSLVGHNGIHFAFAKATEGKDYVDSTFDDKWKHYHQLKLVPGAYHYYRSDFTPQQNFDNARQHIFDRVNFTKEHHFMVDFEDNKGHLS